MEFLEFIKWLFKAAAVTILPAFLIWWWNGSTRRQQQTYKAYLWMFFISVGVFGVLFDLFTTGSIHFPATESDY